MLKIACKYDIASTTLPDANALVDDNETLNLVRLHTFLHQLAKKIEEEWQNWKKKIEKEEGVPVQKNKKWK